VLQLQGGILGTFTSLSAGILGMAERASQADQSYRLLGLHMLTSQQNAMKLDMATKALGADLKDIIWDDELRSRAQGMFNDIDRMAAADPDAAKNLKRVRDFRAEFARLSVAGQIFERDFTSSVIKAFGGGDIDKGFQKLHNFVDWAEENLPHWADALAAGAVPILKETGYMLGEVGKAAQGAGVLIMNTIGLLSGDKSLQGDDLTFDKVSRSIEHLLHWATQAEGWIVKTEQALPYLAKGMLMVADDLTSSLGHEFSTFGKLAIAEFDLIETRVERFTRNIRSSPTMKLFDMASGTHFYQEDPNKIAAQQQIDAIERDKTLSTAEKVRRARAVRDQYGDGGDDAREQAIWARINSLTTQLDSNTADVKGAFLDPRAGAEFDKVRKIYADPIYDPFAPESELPMNRFIPRVPAGVEGGGQPMREASPDTKRIMQMIHVQAALQGVPEALALAVAKHESGFNPYAMSTFTKADGSRGHAFGVMQLIPETAKAMGVDDPLNAGQSIEGGLKFLHSLLAKYGDESKALAAYDAGPAAVDKAVARFGADWLAHMPAETRAYIPSALGLERQFQGGVPGGPLDAGVQQLSRPTSEIAPAANVVTNNVQRPMTVNIPITVTGDASVADLRRIQSAALEGARAALAEDAQGSMVQLTPVY